MNTFPLHDDNAAIFRRSKEQPKHQVDSFWLSAKRDGFTRKCAKHLEDLGLPMTGVTLSAAARHGGVW